MKNRRSIVVVDKKEKFSYIFRGFRKHKYVISNTLTVYDENFINVLQRFDLFFVVIYEFKDVLELFPLNNNNLSMIVASENPKILKKVRKLECFKVIDLTNKFNIASSLLDCVDEIFR